MARYTLYITMDVWGNTSAEIQRMVAKIINWTLSVDRPVPSNDDDDSDRLVRPFPWHTNIVHLVYHYIIWDPSVLLASKW